MKNFVFGSLLLLVLLFSSCANTESGCETLRFTRTDLPTLITPSDSLQVFDIEIAFMGNTISGMMLVKRLATDAVRVKVQNYFGLSLMALELTPDSLTVHHIFEAMNKPFIVKIFEEDFRLIFGLNLPKHFSARQCVGKKGNAMLTVQTSKGEYRYRFAVSGQLSEIRSPFVIIKNKSKSADFHDIQLKHTGIFSPTVVIKSGGD